MVRYMADSVDCAQFTKHVQVPGKGLQLVSLTAGYLPPSSYADSSQRCGGTDVKIDVAGVHPEGDVLDVEQGDATPDQAPGWVKSHNATHPAYPGIIYCNRGTITAVANALAAANLQVVRDYRWWIATLDGTERVADMTGVTAIQVWGASHFPDNIDLSIVYDDSWKAATVAVDLTPAAIEAIATAIRGDKFTLPGGAKEADQTAWRDTLVTVKSIQTDVAAIKHKLGIA